jgi:hypothetical protein
MAETLYGGVDPALINRALEAQGSTYRIPMPAMAVPAAPGVQPLTPEEQALGAQLAQQQLDQDVQVAANASHAPQPTVPAMMPSAPVASGPGLDWQPGVQDRVDRAPPAARMSMAQPQPSPGPQMAGTSVGGPSRVPGMPKSPYAGMAREAEQLQGTEESQALSAEVSGDINVETAKDAIQRQGAAQSETGEAVGAVYDKASDAGKKYVDRLKTFDDDQRAVEQRIQGEIDADTKFINEYEPKDRRTKGQRVGSAIAIALGGLGAALQRAVGVQARNTSLDLIQSQIERDLEMQRGMLDNKKTALAAKTSSLGQARERYKDDRDALGFARVLELDGYLKEIEAAKARGLGKEAAAKADELSALLGADRDNTLLTLHGKKADQYRAEAQQARLAKYREDQARAAAARGPSTMDRLKLQEQALKNEKLKQELSGDTTPEMKQDAAKSLRLYEPVVRDRDRLAKMIQQLDADGTDDVPGIGPLAGRVGDWATSARGVELRRSVRRVLKAQLRDESGASISDDELDGYMEDRGMGPTSTNADFMAGLRDVVGEFDQKLTIARRAAGDKKGAASVGQQNELSELTRPHGAQ